MFVTPGKRSLASDPAKKNWAAVYYLTDVGGGRSSVQKFSMELGKDCPQFFAAEEKKEQKMADASRLI
jgi:hypothetical protein